MSGAAEPLLPSGRQALLAMSAAIARTRTWLSVRFPVFARSSLAAWAGVITISEIFTGCPLLWGVRSLTPGALCVQARSNGSNADLAYAGQVRDYLAYCEAARGQMEACGGRIDPRYHPSADGAVKMIPHGSDRAAADAIRQAFGELAGEGR